MRSLVLVLFLGCAACAAVIAQPAGPAGVPSFRDAQAVCRAVAEGRADFVDVATGYEFREEEEWTSVDVDNDGTPEEIAILVGGTSRTPGIVRRTGEGAPYEDRYIESDYDDEFGPWSGQLALVRSNGRIYEVFYSDAATRDYPVYLAIHLPGGEGRWLCSFQSAAPPPRLTPLRADAAPLCAAIEQRRTSIAAPAPMSLDDRDAGLDHFVRPEGAVDFMNDGRPRDLLRVLHASEAGAGCGTEFLALAEGYRPYERREETEAIALAELQTMNRDNLYVRLANDYGACHGNVAQFHTIDGSVVFEQRFPGERPQRHDHEFWWVARVENGRAVRLCKATAFEPRPRTIAYNAALYPRAR